MRGLPIWLRLCRDAAVGCRRMGHGTGSGRDPMPPEYPLLTPASQACCLALRRGHSPERHAGAWPSLMRDCLPAHAGAAPARPPGIGHRPAGHAGVPRTEWPGPPAGRRQQHARRRPAGAGTLRVLRRAERSGKRTLAPPDPWGLGRSAPPPAGRGGVGSGGTDLSLGPITGFGSFFVDGIEFDTPGAAAAVTDGAGLVRATRIELRSGPTTPVVIGQVEGLMREPFGRCGCLRAPSRRPSGVGGLEGQGLPDPRPRRSTAAFNPKAA
jgi:hypothetical protein